MHIIDITAELNDRTKTYNTDPKVHLEQHASIATDGYALTRLELGSHSGTHVDAQSHVIEGGETAKDISLNVLLGKCYVVDVEDFKVPRNAKRVLMKGNTMRDSTLNLAQAEQLIKAGVRLMGTDGMSIGSDEVHYRLLEEGCVVLEMLDLSKAQPGPYFLCALPLRIAADGAPARVCLIDQYTGEKA